MTPADAENGAATLKSGSTNHTCDVKLCPVSAGIKDVTDEMLADISNRATIQCTASAIDLANEVRMEFEKIYDGSPVVLLNLQQLQSAVYRSRTKGFSDWGSQIRQYPLAFCDPQQSNPKLFSRFMLDIVLDGKIVKIVGWAHPNLLFLLRDGRSPLFIDGTFRVVPVGFYQLLVLMVYSCAHNVFVPTWFILLPGKSEDIYHHAFQNAISASNWKLEASTVTCDFELGILQAAKTHFCGTTQSPPATLVGCLFHFKQAYFGGFHQRNWRKLRGTSY